MRQVRTGRRVRLPPSRPTGAPSDVSTLNILNWNYYDLNITPSSVGVRFLIIWGAAGPGGGGWGRGSAPGAGDTQVTINTVDDCLRSPKKALLPVFKIRRPGRSGRRETIPYHVEEGDVTARLLTKNVQCDRFKLAGCAVAVRSPVRFTSLQSGGFTRGNLQRSRL